MDICPIKCLTKDQIQLTIDGTLMYHISKADAAVYETDDVLNVFYQTAQQATRTAISALLASEMQSKETIISTLVTDAINKTLGGKGIVCDALYYSTDWR
jgi:regulator of protease activity HflC (stomatin/prohibitin superfamily)